MLLMSVVMDVHGQPVQDIAIFSLRCCDVAALEERLDHREPHLQLVHGEVREAQSLANTAFAASVTTAFMVSKSNAGAKKSFSKVLKGLEKDEANFCQMTLFLSHTVCIERSCDLALCCIVLSQNCIAGSHQQKQQILVKNF
jgi:hypothetical protein